MTATMAGSPKNALRLTPVSDALKILANRRRDRVMAAVEDPGNLKIGYLPASDHRGAGFVIRPVNGASIGGDIGEHFKTRREMFLSNNAVDSILKHGNISLPAKMLPGELPRLGTLALREAMEKMHGLNILTTSKGGIGERQVEAFIPGKVNPLPDHALIGTILERVAARYSSQIKGVRFHNDLRDDSQDAVKRYWIVFGKPVLDENPDDILMKNYPMLDITSSDIGLGQVDVSLGLIRIVCANGMISTAWDGGKASWSRQGESGDFFDKISGIVDVASQFAADVGTCLEASTKRSLGMHGIEATHALKEAGIISNKHAELAETLVGRDDPKTDFEFSQCLTESCQGLPKMPQRQRAEGLVLKILMRHGGYERCIRNGLTIRDLTPKKVKGVTAGTVADAGNDESEDGSED